jgi:hypothetical protein
MDAQTSLPQQYEDPQEVSIEVQQRLKQKSKKQLNYTHRLNRCFWKTLDPCIPIDRV